MCVCGVCGLGGGGLGGWSLYADLASCLWRNTPALTRFSATVSLAAQQNNKVLYNLLFVCTGIVSFTFYLLGIGWHSHPLIPIFLEIIINSYISKYTHKKEDKDQSHSGRSNTSLLRRDVFINIQPDDVLSGRYGLLSLQQWETSNQKSIQYHKTKSHNIHAYLFSCTPIWNP